MKVLAISGSLRRDSYNTRLLRAAAELAPADVDVELFPPDRLGAIPPYDGDVHDLGTPETVSELKHAIASADAVLFATPEYNSSIPGQLKNALDWVSAPSPRARCAARRRRSSGPARAPTARSGRRPISARCSAHSAPGSSTPRSPLRTPARSSTIRKLVDPETREQVAQAVDDLAAAVRALAPAVLAA